MKVYVAASSRELERAEKWMNRLKEAGIEVTSDWVELIRAAGEPNPRGATTKQRLAWSDHDLANVEAADLLWFLVPDEGTGRGAYYELGFAVAQGKLVVCSGDTKQSIFTAQAEEHEFDADGFEQVLNIARGFDAFLGNQTEPL